MSITETFLTESAWAYNGVYVRIGDLPGITDRNEKLWTMLGALLMELSESGEKEVTIYHDTRLVEEWNEDVGFLSQLSKRVAARLKDRDGLTRSFLTLSLEKAERATIDSQIEKIRLT